jgi:hypothetical protein
MATATSSSVNVNPDDVEGFRMGYSRFINVFLSLDGAIGMLPRRRYYEFGKQFVSLGVPWLLPLYVPVLINPNGADTTTHF